MKERAEAVSKNLVLRKARFLGWDVTPFLHDWLSDLPGVSSGPSADLLGHIDTLLGGGELGHQLGHVLAGPLGLEGASLLGGVLDNGLLLVITLLVPLLEPTSRGGTNFSRNIL